jgi:hypothetical protein
MFSKTCVSSSLAAPPYVSCIHVSMNAGTIWDISDSENYDGPCSKDRSAGLPSDGVILPGLGVAKSQHPQKPL